MEGSAPRWREALSRDEMRALLEMRDWKSWRSLASTGRWSALSFALVARWPNPLTVLVALFVIGARQLGLAVLMHEAAHRTLFTNRQRERLGRQLAVRLSDLERPPALPALPPPAPRQDLDDRKIPISGWPTPFPITPASLRRKIWRDLSGQTGWKRCARRCAAIWVARAAVCQRNFDAGLEALHGVVITNAVLLGLLVAVGHPALYLLWVGAWLTTYSLVMRIRSIAEHAMIPDPADRSRQHAHHARALVGAAPDRARTTSTTTSSIIC